MAQLVSTDYLVVGAGASGMAFVDALIDHSDADVVMVDRRHAPGGHWIDAYSFVRLHQPSAYYGVNSTPLGGDTIDERGPNAGLYERATAPEICDYYRRVMEDRLLASDRVRFSAMCDYVAGGPTGHRIVSRLTGEVTDVQVRRRLVDATYLEASIPSRHIPTFTVDPGVRFVAPNALVEQPEGASRFTVIGSGKTAMDTCSWLLDNGVPADAIRWIRPRDAWVQNRAYLQPLSMLPAFMDGFSRQIQAAAEADDLHDLWRRLEASDQFMRLDTDVEPTMYRGATLSAVEVDQLRRIEDVVRAGHVRHIGVDRIHMDGAELPTDRGQVHIDCTASGVSIAPARAIFESHRITLQSIQAGIIPFSAALTGVVEATHHDEDEKNALCPPNPYFTTPAGWVTGTLISQRARARWREDAELTAWLTDARLEPVRGVGEHRDDPTMQSALARFVTHIGPALENLARLAQPEPTPAPV